MRTGDFPDRHRALAMPWNHDQLAHLHVGQERIDLAGPVANAALWVLGIVVAEDRLDVVRTLDVLQVQVLKPVEVAKDTVLVQKPLFVLTIFACPREPYRHNCSFYYATSWPRLT